MTTTTTTTKRTTTTYNAPLISGSYIQFVIVVSLQFQMILTDLVIQLQFIFITVLQVPSNQIKMSAIPFGRKRSTTDYDVYTQLYSTNTESARSLLSRIQQQLDDENSEFRKYNLTAGLNSNSIKDISNMYVCADQTAQQTRCNQNITLIPFCEAPAVSKRFDSKSSHGFLLTPIWALVIMEILLMCYYKFY